MQSKSGSEAGKRPQENNIIYMQKVEDNNYDNEEGDAEKDIMYNINKAIKDTPRRLEGGLADKVTNIDDVLRVDMLDDPGDEKISKDSTVSDSQAPLRTQIMQMCRSIFFIIMWIIFTILLIVCPSDKEIYRYVAVPTGNEIFKYKVPVESVTYALTVYMTGPFSNMPAKKKDNYLECDLRLEDNSTGKEQLLTVIDTRYFDLLENKNYKIHTKVEETFIMKDNNEWKESDDSDLILAFVHNSKEAITIFMEFDNAPVNKTKGIICGVIILIFLYTMIVWEVINRTLASIIAAILSVSILALLGNRPTLETLVSWIDRETLMLLFGMMILVAILSESGIFDYLAVYAYQITHGHIWPLINTLCVFAVVLSAFLDNVTLMLLITPVTIRLCEVIKIKPVPVLVSMVLFSNLGAAATPVGDPPNIIICMHPYIISNDVTFNEFMLHMTPGIIIACITSYIHLRFIYRKPNSLGANEVDDVEDLKREINIWERTASGLFELSTDEINFRQKLLKKVNVMKQRLTNIINTDNPPSPIYAETLDQLKKQYPIRSKRLLYESVAAFTLVILLFITHSVPDLHYLSLGWAALIGALLLLIIADIDDLEAIISRVEWPTLIFFASLFIVMESLTELGLVEVIGDYVVYIIKLVEPKWRLTVAIILICWVSALASAFLNNIPVTTMMIRIIVSLAQNKDLGLPLHPLVWALAFGACFGGNGTMIGASANVVCAGLIEQHGYKFGFVEFFIVGFPIMLTSVFVSTLYILLMHVVFQWHVI